MSKKDRAISIPVALTCILSKKKIQYICREFIDNFNSAPIDKLIEDAEFKYKLLTVFKSKLQAKQREIATAHMIEANKEYGESYDASIDDCQEFNVPNM